MNLVRAGQEEAVCDEFLTLFQREYRDRWEQITWEQLHGMARERGPTLHRLCRYLETKTAGLKPAFQLELSPPLTIL